MSYSDIDSELSSLLNSNDVDIDSLILNPFEKQIDQQMKRFFHELFGKRQTSDSTIIRVLCEMNTLCEDMEEEYRSSVSDTTVDRTDCMLLFLYIL